MKRALFCHLRVLVLRPYLDGAHMNKLQGLAMYVSSAGQKREVHLMSDLAFWAQT